MSISDAELEQLERLAAEARGGEWRVIEDTEGKLAVDCDQKDYPVCQIQDAGWASDQEERDADYIAYANPERIGRLVADYKRLAVMHEALVAELRRVREEVQEAWADREHVERSYRRGDGP